MDLAGRRFVITGANTGLGRATAVALARAGAELWLLNRSAERSASVLEEIRAIGAPVQLVTTDLADLASVRTAADTLAAKLDRIDVLVNNAGLARLPGATHQGIEMTFGVNHLGHFLLTKRLLPLLQGNPARIVNVASGAHYQATGIDWDALRRPTATYTGLAEYSVSKLANVLFTRELAARLGVGRVHSYALHPGAVASDVWRAAPAPIRWFLARVLISNEEGAKALLYCATSPDCAAETGQYYNECKVRYPSRVAQDPALARELWARSEEWVAPFAS